MDTYYLLNCQVATMYSCQPATHDRN